MKWKDKKVEHCTETVHHMACLSEIAGHGAKQANWMLEIQNM